MPGEARPAERGRRGRRRRPGLALAVCGCCTLSALAHPCTAARSGPGFLPPVLAPRRELPAYASSSLRASALFDLGSLLQPGSSNNNNGQRKQAVAAAPGAGGAYAAAATAAAASATAAPRPAGDEDVAAAAAEAERLERAVNRLGMIYGWCTSPADEAYMAGAREELRPLLARLSGEDRAMVDAALQVAYQAHLGQKRKSGEPYITHPVAVAQIVAEMGMDAETVAAALLHDTVEDTSLRFADVEAVFGPTVRRLVEGETKMSKMPKRLAGVEAAAGLLAGSDGGKRPGEEQVLNLSHLLMAIAQDWRVLVVKLGDRLHNLRTIGSLKPAKQARIARETMMIYVPLADRLGLHALKSELEDLSFRVLHPLEHAAVASAVQSRLGLLASLHTNRFGGQRMTLQAALTEALPRLLVARGALKGHTVAVTLEGRPPATVYGERGAAGVLALLEGGGEGAEGAGATGSGRAQPQQLGSGEGDLLTLKVVVSAAPAGGSRQPQRDVAAEHALCARVLEAIEAALHASGPSPRDDLILFPKANGYQALHAVVRSPQVLPYPLEVRVSTDEMDLVSRHGLLAIYTQTRAAAPQAAPLLPLQLPWLEAISARTKRAVLQDPSITAAQLVASLQEDLAVRQLEWNAALAQAKAAGAGGGPGAYRGPQRRRGDVVDFLATAVGQEEEQQEAAVGQGQQQVQQQRPPAELWPWQTPVYVWPWALIGNDDPSVAFPVVATSSSSSPPSPARLRRQARGAVTPREPERVFDSGEVTWLREAELRHGRMALVLLAFWGALALTDVAAAASASALAGADMADLLREGADAASGPAALDVLEALLSSSSPLLQPASAASSFAGGGALPLPRLPSELLGLIALGEVVGAVVPNTIDINQRWQAAKLRSRGLAPRELQRQGPQQDEEEDENEAAARVGRSVATGLIPLLGSAGNAVGGGGGVRGGTGGALLTLEAPWRLVALFQDLVQAERLMGRAGMLLVLLVLGAWL